MRIDAAVAVRSFLDAVEDEDLAPLRPLVPQLLQQFLTLSNEVGGLGGYLRVLLWVRAWGVSGGVGVGGCLRPPCCLLPLPALRRWTSCTHHHHHLAPCLHTSTAPRRARLGK